MIAFPTGKYRTAVIDPPWPLKFIDRKVRPSQTEMPYKTMSIDEIKALPLPSILAEHAFVFLWTTQMFLLDALEILQWSWSLKYAFTMCWHKPAGFTPFNRPMFNAEFILVGRRGSPQLLGNNDFSVCFNAPARGHSVKPAEFYNTLARVTEPPRIDLFSRRLIPGFDVWGDEAPTQTLENSQFALFESRT